MVNLRRPNTVRPLHHRSLGSGTRLVDEFEIPAVLYHSGRGLRWAFRTRRRVVGALAVVLLWMWTGSLVQALLVCAVFLVLGLTAWVAWRKARAAAGGADLSVRQTWTQYRQRNRLLRQWGLACATGRLLGGNGEPPTLRRLRHDAQGTLTATVRSGEVGVPVPDIMARTITLAEVIGCREVIVTPTDPGVAKIAFHWADPVGRGLALADLPIAPTGRIAYGIRQDGSPASINMGQSVLIGGLTRHGKSNTVWCLLADLLRQEVPVCLYVSDPKGGVEMDAFHAALGREVGGLKVRQYASTAAETVKMLAEAEKAMQVRQHEMQTNGVRKVQPSHDNPLVIVILDETLPLTDVLKKGTDSPLGRIAYTGAHAGYVVWALTQVAQVDSIGRFRDLIPQRICFATPNPQVTDSVLGQGSEAAGARCSEVREPGVGFSYADGEHHPRKFRAASVTDPDARLIAAGRLPTVVENKARSMYDQREEDRTRAGRSRNGRTGLYRVFVGDEHDDTSYLAKALAPYTPEQRREYLRAIRPLYIGISSDVIRRAEQHDRNFREFMQGNIRRDVEWFPTRKAALAAEKVAIETERPLFNVQHNSRAGRRAALRPALPGVQRRERETAGRK